MFDPSDGLPSRKTEPPVYKLISVFVGAFLASCDLSMFLVTQDRIAANFHSINYAPLIIASFNLGHSIALPLYGIFSDRYGCKPVLIHAYLLFALGCAVSGLTSYFPLFFLGRLISGVGGAGMLDLFVVLVCELYDMEAVTKLRGYIMATSILGKSCGGPIGGVLTDHVGWRWSLAGQTPIAIACAFLAWWLLPPGNTDKESADHETTLFQNLDVPGIALFTASIGSAVLVLDLGGQIIPWDHPLLFFAAIFGCFSGVALFINEWKRKGSKLLPPELLLSPRLRTVFVGQILFSCALDGILSSIGPFFAWTERFTATATAARLWPQAIGAAAGALTGSQIISRTQTHTKISIIGALTSVLSYLLMSVQWADGIDGAEIGYTLTMGGGGGLFFAGQFEALVESAPASQRATATGLYYLCQQAGGTFGAALMASLTQGFFRRELLTYTAGLAPLQRHKFVEIITRGPGFADNFPTNVQAAVKECYQHAYSHTIIVPFVCVLVILPGIFTQRDQRKPSYTTST